MRCSTENALLLASLALQAEFGDYQPEVLNPISTSAVCVNKTSSLNAELNFIYLYCPCNIAQ